MGQATIGGLRLVRAVLTAATVLSLAAGAHTMGEGPLPGGTVMIALGALVLLAVSVLSRWHLRTWTLLPALGAIQVALHAAFSFLVPGNLAVVTDATQAHAHGAATAVTFAMGPDVSTHVHGPSSSGWMLLAHLAATVVTAVVLVGADRAARGALHWCRSVLPLLRRPVVVMVDSPARERATELVRVVRPGPGVACSRPRRGPPLAAAAA